MDKDNSEAGRMKGRRVMDIDQLAEYLNLGKRTVYRLVADGEIPYARIGGALRFPSWSIDAWLDTLVEKSLSDSASPALDSPDEEAKQ